MAWGHSGHKPLCTFLSKVMRDGASQSDFEFRIFPVLNFRETPSATWQVSFAVKSKVWRSTAVIFSLMVKQEWVTLWLCIDPPCLGINGAIFTSFPAFIQRSMLSGSRIIVLRTLSIITCITLLVIALPIVQNIRFSTQVFLLIPLLCTGNTVSATLNWLCRIRIHKHSLNTDTSTLDDWK